MFVDDKLIEMPEFALANSMWLGRVHSFEQNATTGLRLLLGLSRHCFWKLVLGRSTHPNDRRRGITGNRIFVTDGSPTLCDVLSPSLQDLSDNFVVVFGQSIEDLTMCQLWTLSREVYRTLAEERCRVNIEFCRVALYARKMGALSQQGAPQQFFECALQMPGRRRVRQ